MKTLRILILTVQILSTVAIGYCLRGWRERSERANLAEELAAAESFSEIENAFEPDSLRFFGQSPGQRAHV